MVSHLLRQFKSPSGVPGGLGGAREGGVPTPGRVGRQGRSELGRRLGGVVARGRWGAGLAPVRGPRERERRRGQAGRPPAGAPRRCGRCRRRGSAAGRCGGYDRSPPVGAAGTALSRVVRLGRMRRRARGLARCGAKSPGGGHERGPGRGLGAPLPRRGDGGGGNGDAHVEPSTRDSRCYGARTLSKPCAARCVEWGCRPRSGKWDRVR